MLSLEVAQDLCDLFAAALHTASTVHLLLPGRCAAVTQEVHTREGGGLLPLQHHAHVAELLQVTLELLTLLQEQVHQGLLVQGLKVGLGAQPGHRGPLHVGHVGFLQVVEVKLEGQQVVAHTGGLRHEELLTALGHLVHLILLGQG